MTKGCKYPILFKSMIPRIDVRNCIARKIYEGRLSFSFEAESSLVDIPFTAFSSPVQAELKYEIFGDDTVEVKGSVTFSLKGACSRCLSDAERLITGEAYALFVPKTPEDEEYGYRNGCVDLSEFLRDAVLFALPSRLLCDSCNQEE